MHGKTDFLNCLILHMDDGQLVLRKSEDSWNPLANTSPAFTNFEHAHVYDNKGN